MGQISLQSVTKELGGHPVLRNLSLELPGGEIVGIVGANGSGKTTLFRLITGQLKPEIGSVAVSRDLQVGYLPQKPEMNADATLFEAVSQAHRDVFRLQEKLVAVSDRIQHTAPGPEQDALLAEYDRLHARVLAAGGYDVETRVHEILGGLGFRPADLQLPIGALSGGQQCRAALAKLLLETNNYLLLDEPTNHLDLKAVRWLELFLAGHKGGAAIVSHDRYLLDRAVSRIIEVDRGQVTNYRGNYSTYVKERDVRRKSQQRRFTEDQAFLAKERAFITKHMGKQRTAEAKGRLTRLERRLAAGEFETDLPAERRGLSLDLNAEQQLTGWILDVQQLSKAFDDKPLFADLSFQIQADTRLGILGPNGTGKSTLLKILVEQLAPDSGRIRRDPHLALGYYAQDAGFADTSETMLAWLQSRYPHLTETAARSRLAQFLFRGDDVFKSIPQLSGGERARLRLLDLFLQQPNTLVLDEPTNHLDIPAREALEAALGDYPGALIVVSHDRYLLDRICNRLLVLAHAGHRLVHGSYTNYLATVEAESATRPTGAANPRKPKRSKSKSNRPTPRKKSPFARLPLDELEALIHEHETGLDDLNARFADTTVITQPDELAALQAALAEHQSKLNELHAAWEAKVEELDA